MRSARQIRTARTLTSEEGKTTDFCYTSRPLTDSTKQVFFDQDPTAETDRVFIYIYSVFVLAL